jgi:hypothetical protein
MRTAMRIRKPMGATELRTAPAVEAQKAQLCSAGLVGTPSGLLALLLVGGIVA